MQRQIPLLTAVIVFTAVAFAPQIFNDSDTYWHIAAGARMLADRAVLAVDPFSYTFAGAPWNAHEWLSEVVMAAVFRLGGWSALALLFAATFALAAALLSRDLGRWLGEPTRSLVVALALCCMTLSLLARPHLLALPLLEIWTAGLVIAREKKRAPSFALLPAMTLWANLHGGFAFGLLLAGLLGLEALIEDRRWETLKSWAFFGLGALVAAALTPHFVDGLLFPLRLVAMRELANVGEWQPTGVPSPFEIVVMAGIYFLLSRGIRLPASRVLIALLLLHLALQHQRHQIVFAVTVPLLLAAPLARALETHPAESKPGAAWLAGTLAAVLAVSAARLSFVLPRGGEAVTPAAALAHVPREIARTPVLNEYGFGGYLVFVGIKPFIDSRAELYGDAFLANYARIVSPEPAALEATLRKYHVGWTLLTPASPATAMMDLMPGWRRIYADKIAVVHAPIIKASFTRRP